MSEINFRVHGDPTYPKGGRIFFPAAPPEPSAVDRLAAIVDDDAADRVSKQAEDRAAFFAPYIPLREFKTDYYGVVEIESPA